VARTNAAEQPLVASLLDRLLDEEPTASRDAPKNQNQLLRELKQSVRRDLENLLNTRQRCLDLPEDLAELSRSLVNYGIPDFTGSGMGSAKSPQDICRLLKEVIVRYEPRFKRVAVQLLDNSESLDRTLRFRIDTVLRVEPVAERVIFDSTLQPGTGTFDVREGADE
jgi:type VI secretion system protein ImpF